MALIEQRVHYLLLLDLAKAYDLVLKDLLIKKLEKLIPTNLGNQLKAFIATVVGTVTGDITNTAIPMPRGLM